MAGLLLRTVSEGAKTDIVVGAMVAIFIVGSILLRWLT